MKIALIDYGAGNLFSVQRALKFAGADFYIATRPGQISKADKLVLPGVGAFCDGMNGLKKNRLIQAIKLAVQQQKPIFGICLGMQLMMNAGHEFGIHHGLDLIDGVVNKIKTKEKLPHVGWNDLKILKPTSLLTGINSGEYFYFVHSFVARPKNSYVAAASTNYGGDDFCSVLEYKNIYGTQFHPEKSGPKGITIYQNFVNL